MNNFFSPPMYMYNFFFMYSINFFFSRRVAPGGGVALALGLAGLTPGPALYILDVRLSTYPHNTHAHL